MKWYMSLILVMVVIVIGKVILITYPSWPVFGLCVGVAWNLGYYTTKRK